MAKRPISKEGLFLLHFFNLSKVDINGVEFIGYFIGSKLKRSQQGQMTSKKVIDGLISSEGTFL